MADHLRSSLCENALMMAIGHRTPPQGLIHHSDRGVQYACGPYRKILDRHGIKASMSRKGDCYDNAPMESFFSSLKTELVHRTRFRTRREAKAALFEYIEIFYNKRRRHSGVAPSVRIPFGQGRLCQGLGSPRAQVRSRPQGRHILGPVGAAIRQNAEPGIRPLEAGGDAG